MGRENHTAHFSFEADPCACFKLMGEASGCCDNKSVILQIDDDQAASAQLIVAPVALPLVYEFEFSIIYELEQSFDKEFSPKKFLRPPPLEAYIANCSLVFYDEEIVSLS